MAYNKVEENNSAEIEDKIHNEKQTLSATFYCGYDRIVFSHGCLEALGSPKYVQVLVNPENTSIVLVTSDEYKKDSFEVFHDTEENAENTGEFVLEGEQILSRFVELMSWEKDGIYACEGMLADRGVILFELISARKIQADVTFTDANKKSNKSGSLPCSFDEFWNMVVETQGKIVKTVTGVRFKYKIIDDAIQLNNTKRKISRASMERAYNKVMSGQVKVARDLNMFGEAYVMALFRRIERDYGKRK